jgi:hypothetical protein
MTPSVIGAMASSSERAMIAIRPDYTLDPV